MNIFGGSALFDVFLLFLKVSIREPRRSKTWPIGVGRPVAQYFRTIACLLDSIAFVLRIAMLVVDLGRIVTKRICESASTTFCGKVRVNLPAMLS